MKFVTVRELRGHSAEVWRTLDEEHDIIVTSNGKPKALMIAIGEEDFEETLAAIRSARAAAAIRSMQKRGRQAGLDKMTLDEINAEIAVARAERRGTSE